jgi:hypothetical protein
MLSDHARRRAFEYLFECAIEVARETACLVHLRTYPCALRRLHSVRRAAHHDSEARVVPRLLPRPESPRRHDRAARRMNIESERSFHPRPRSCVVRVLTPRLFRSRVEDATSTARRSASPSVSLRPGGPSGPRRDGASAAPMRRARCGDTRPERAIDTMRRLSPASTSRRRRRTLRSSG